jgi:hypothetical protein
MPLGACAALALLAAGCGDNTTTSDGSADQSAVPDMAVPVVHDMTVLPDMTTPRDMTALSGTTLLLDVEGLWPVPTDGGVQVVTARAFMPVVTFGVGSPMHDYDDRGGGLFGCFVDHYDLAGAGRKPSPDIDDGVVTFTNYVGGPLLATGMAAPSEIDCVINPNTGTYGCLFGSMGMPGTLVTAINPFAPGVSPLMPDQPIKITSTGGTILGKIDTNAQGKNPVPTNPVAVMESLNAPSLYSTSANTTFTYYCPLDKDANGNAGKPGAPNCAVAPVLLTYLIGSDIAPGQANYPGGTYAVGACVALLGPPNNTTTVTIKKEVIAAMVGNGGHIGAFQTIIGRGSIPPLGVKDSLGNPITAAVARGVFGVSSYP